MVPRDNLSKCPPLHHRFIYCLSHGYIRVYSRMQMRIRTFIIQLTHNCSILLSSSSSHRNMFDKKRKVTTIVYLSTLLLSIIVCFIPFDSSVKLSILVVLLIVQCLSSVSAPLLTFRKYICTPPHHPRRGTVINLFL